MKILIALVILASVLVSPQARDNQRPSIGTAVLSGLVVADEPNGQPIRRAFITVIPNNDSRQFQTSTDDRGRFTIGNLPAGNVRLMVSKPSYVQTYYGARQPGSNVGQPIALSDGQTVDVTVRLPRGSVIAGTVRDENGQPMPGVGVRVQRVSVSASGQRTFTPTSGALIPSTDDRGAFRMFGLPAGDYVVSAQPRLAAGSEVRQTSAAELQWAERQVRGGAASAPNSTAPPEQGQAITYSAVYFPGTVRAASAGIVSLATGQERNGIDLRMQFVATARIQGIVLSPQGQPASGIQLSLLPRDETAATQDASRLTALMEVGMLMGTSARTDQTGAFLFPGVEPGSYIVLARTAPAGRGLSPAATQWAMADVDVDGRDQTGLSLRLANGQSLSGRFVFEGRAPIATPVRTSVSLSPVDARGLGANVLTTLTSASDPFEVAGLVPASYRASAAVLVGGWTLKSIIAGGKDVTDVPLEIKQGEDVPAVVVTFTDAAAEVTGILYDGANRPSSDLSIVLFAADRSMWFQGSRRVRPAVRPANDGRFTFSGLAPGDYYLAALTEVSPADLTNAQFLEQVVPGAVKVAVAAGERKTQDLKIAR